MGDDAVARFHVADLRTDFAHDAAGLMAEQVRQAAVRALHAVNLADLRPADAAGLDVHQHLAVSPARALPPRPPRVAALFNQNGSGAFSSPQSEVQQGHAALEKHGLGDWAWRCRRFSQPARRRAGRGTWRGPPAIACAAASAATEKNASPAPMVSTTSRSSGGQRQAASRSCKPIVSTAPRVSQAYCARNFFLSPASSVWKFSWRWPTDEHHFLFVEA